MSKDLRFQSSNLAHASGDARQRLERQMAAFGMRRGPRRGVDLHQRNLRARFFQFSQPLRVGLALFGRRFLAVDAWNKSLDHNRSFAGGRQVDTQYYYQ